MGTLVVVFIVVPLLELYVLVQVAQAIGVVPALVALAVVSVAGASLVKRQGLAVLRRMRDDLDARRVPTEPLAEGGLLLGAGVLLTVPGFVTDAAGLVLLVPPVRRALARTLRTRWSRRPGVVTATYTGSIVDVRERADDAADDRADRRPPEELPPA